jgi:hypothetical protein
MCSGVRFLGSATTFPFRDGHSFLYSESGERWYTTFGDHKERRICFDPNTVISNRMSRGDSGSAAHEWIKNDAVAQGKRGSDDLAHESLRLERGMGR